MKKTKMLGLLLALLIFTCSFASAGILTDGWTLNLGGIDGITDPFEVNDITMIQFYGPAHSQVVQPGSGTDPLIGSISIVDGLLKADGLFNSSSESILPGVSRMDVDWQMTFDFSLAVETTGYDANGYNAQHLGAGTYGGLYVDGILDIYIDGPGFTNPNPENASGYTDGVHVASFSVVPYEGGLSYNTTASDGQDDATFSLSWLNPLYDIFYDDFGNLLEVGALIAFTDSNLDGDPTNVGPYSIGTTVTDALWPNISSNWPFFLKAAGSSSGAFFEEDGSVRLTVIPEPSTFVLLAFGLLGLGFIANKKNRK